MERAYQVQQMKQIYAEAACVIAWVGPAANNSDIVLAQLNSVGEKLTMRLEILTRSRSKT